MNNPVLLLVSGEVERASALTFQDLAQLPAEHQISDVTRFGVRREGDAVALRAVLDRVGLSDKAKFIGLHASRDDFHASIPLEPIKDRAFLIYRAAGQPLDVGAGGPVRLFIPDHSACHLDEIDECANVKFLDHLELTVDKGFDNRPSDEEEHARLHENDHE